MAVVIKYVVVRNGEEKMTFATKKEADAHDRMLDIADNLYDFLGKCDETLTIDDTQREVISLYLARNSEQVMNILKGIQVKQFPAVVVPEGEVAAEAGEEEMAASEPAPAEKRRGGKSRSSKESNIAI